MLQIVTPLWQRDDDDFHVIDVEVKLCVGRYRQTQATTIVSFGPILRGDSEEWIFRFRGNMREPLLFCWVTYFDVHLSAYDHKRDNGKLTAITPDCQSAAWASANLCDLAAKKIANDAQDTILLRRSDGPLYIKK
jgi:hypothetical protein